MDYNQESWEQNFEGASYADTYGTGPGDSLPQSGGTSFLNKLTGLLGKAADTALDIGGAYGVARVGSLYPTGQANPAAVASSNQSNANAQPFNYKPLIIGGAAFAGLIVLLAVLRKK